MIGTTIGSYEIRAPLGAGGMGEVYRARDSKLGRDVALKILPPTLASDRDRIARFRREAQLLASLNHANIAAIHGLEELDGVPVLVLELVEGPTLADRLVHGPIPIDEAFAIARQVAEALEAAHDHGIIHRDLKPANIKLRADGVVKVLDFGLAKALDDGAGSQGQDSPSAVDGSVRLQPDLTASPTVTTPAMTRIGMIMGTASYMSPEQARGRRVDRGADIWAWGCVLFEMLTGRRTFDGADTTDVIAAVVRGEPDWSRLPGDTPPSVRRLLRRCLEKDPRRRIADIRDARFTLEDLATEPAAPSVARVHASRERVLWAAALVLCIGGSAALLWRENAPAPAPRQMRVDITTPPTTDPVSIALSPDGERVAFVASSDGRPMLWVRSIVTGESMPLPNTDGASFPFWSPDSRSIGFFANERVYRIGVDGGSLKQLAKAPVGSGGTWSRDGTILFTIVPDGPIFSVPDSGGAPATETSSNDRHLTRLQGHRFPQFLPDGRRFIYFMAEPEVRGVYTGTLDGPERRRLFDADAAAVFMPPDRILFFRAGRLYAQRLDSVTLSFIGDPAAVAQGVVVDAAGAMAVSASASGSFIFRTGTANRQRQLAWFDRTGAPIGAAFPLDSNFVLNPAISPDDRQVVLSRSVNGNVDLWLQDLARTDARTKLTSAAMPDIYPVWSPDGRRIAFGGLGSVNLGVVTIPASGGETAAIVDGPDQEIPTDWSRDGRYILYRYQKNLESLDLWAFDRATDTSFPVSSHPDADERQGQFSPDVRWVAFESDESGRFQIYVQSFPDHDGKTVVSTGGGSQARWSPDGNTLYYIAPDARLMAVALTYRGARQVEPASPTPLFQARINGVTTGGSLIEYDLSSDGKRFLMNTLVEHSGSPITLLVNAFAAPQ